MTSPISFITDRKLFSYSITLKSKPNKVYLFIVLVQKKSFQQKTSS